MRSRRLLAADRRAPPRAPASCWYARSAKAFDRGEQRPRASAARSARGDRPASARCGATHPAIFRTRSASPPRHEDSDRRHPGAPAEATAARRSGPLQARRLAHAARGPAALVWRRSRRSASRHPPRSPSALIEYESELAPEKRRRRSADVSEGSWCQRVDGRVAGESAAAVPDTLYNGIRLADPWPPRRRGFRRIRSRRRTSSIRRRDPDRRRPPAVRRRLPDRRDVARRARFIAPSTTRPIRCCGRRRSGSGTTSTPSARRRDRIRRRWSSATASSSIRTIASSRCGTWAATRRTPATPSRTTASRGTSRRSTSSPAPTSSWRSTAIRPPSGSISTSAIRARRFKMAFWHDHDLAAVHRRRTAFTGREVGRSGLGRRSLDVLLQSVPQRLGLQPARRDRRRAAAGIAATGRPPISSRARRWREGPAGPVGRAPTRRSAAARVQRAGRALQPRLRRLREPAARPVHDLPRRARRPREAERHLRRLQPRRLSLGIGRIGDAFLAVSEHVGDWNWANVQSAGGCCLVVGDRLHFYVSGRRGRAGHQRSGRLQHRPGDAPARRLRVDGSPRRPRIARVRSRRPDAGHAGTTRPVRFIGPPSVRQRRRAERRAARRGARSRGRVIAAVLGGRAACRSAATARDARVSWAGARDLAALAGTDGALPFLVDRRGALRVLGERDGGRRQPGYVAAGGPAFSGPADTVAAASGR